MENNDSSSEGEQQVQSVPNLHPHEHSPPNSQQYLALDRWVTNEHPKHLSFPAHGSSVVTCLLLSYGRIISASDDHSIRVYSPATGELLQSMDGHKGGVWALAASKDTVVSGSTDRTVRVWDINTGRCIHIFAGHTSTVRCLAIVNPEVVDIEGEGGAMTKEKWPKQSLIVTGSRDNSLRIWTLPHKSDPEYRWSGVDDANAQPSEVCRIASLTSTPVTSRMLLQEDAKENPYHRLHMKGHDHTVRALAARGRTLVSGSYDGTVRVWDIITGECKRVLVGHTQEGKILV